ncbi:MAG: type II toxin-antitoxin system death-on-curing family toxin [Candidatus Paceibacterota bacterium]
MKYLSEEDIIEINSFIIDETGGSHGIRDLNSISSIVAQPKQKVFSKELHNDIYKKAACYTRGVIFNHPFIDGNKRTAMTSAFIFLEDNGFISTVKKGGIEKYALEIVLKKKNIDSIAAWLKNNTKKI